MTPEEIKKLSREYAEDVFRKYRERNINHLTDEEWELSIDEVAKDTTDAFQWLSKDYCIVPKDRLRELYACYKQHEAVCKEKELYKAEMIARGSTATMRDIFDKDMFEEEGV